MSAPHSTEAPELASISSSLPSSLPSVLDAALVPLPLFKGVKEETKRVSAPCFSVQPRGAEVCVCLCTHAQSEHRPQAITKAAFVSEREKEKHEIGGRWGAERQHRLEHRHKAMSKATFMSESGKGKERNGQEREDKGKKLPALLLLLLLFLAAASKLRSKLVNLIHGCGRGRGLLLRHRRRLLVRPQIPKTHLPRNCEGT